MRHRSRLPDLNRQKLFLAQLLNQLADLVEPFRKKLDAFGCDSISNVMAAVVVLQGEGVHLSLSIFRGGDDPVLLQER